jgi:hypothetical protein
MTKALRDTPTEELRKNVRDGMHSIVGDLLRAAKIGHEIDRIDNMDLKFVQALGSDFDSLTDMLREVHTTLQTVQASYETLVDRVDAEREKTSGSV